MLVRTTLAIGIAADLGTALFSLYVAYRVRQAMAHGIPVEKSLFFWYGLAMFLVLDGGYAVAVLNLQIVPPIPLAVLMLRRILFLLGTAALVSMLFDMAGAGRITPILVVYYAVLITFIEALTLYANPQTHEELVWSIQFVYQNSNPPLLDFVTGIAIFGPLAVASTMVLFRYRLQASRGQRFRLVAFASSVLTFCIGIVIGFWDNDWYWYGLFENRLAFTIATGMLFALRPPWVVRRYWGVKRVVDGGTWPV